MQLNPAASRQNRRILLFKSKHGSFLARLTIIINKYNKQNALYISKQFMIYKTNTQDMKCDVAV